MRKYMWAVIATVSTAALLLVALMSSVASAAPGTSVSAHVVKSDGSTPLEGVHINYQCNGGPILAFGTTDSTGDAGPLDLTTGASCTLFASYQGTSKSQEKTLSAAPETYNFQTSEVTVTLKDHNGGPLAGGQVAYKSGSTTYWLNGSAGASTTDSSGAVTGQMFDGSYDFRMGYHGGTESTEPPVTVTDGATVDFQTGLLSIVYSNSVSYGGSVGDSAWFTKSGTELLPGTYQFHPRGVGVPANPGCKPIPITLPDNFAGTTATKSIFAAQLLDHNGDPLSGGVVQLGVGGWPTIGTTDNTGSFCEVSDGVLGNVKLRMTYHQTTAEMSQNVATNSVFAFQTTQAIIQLENSTGTLTNGGVVHQGVGGWPVIGTTGTGYPVGTVTYEMFSGTYKFRMDFNGSTEEISQDISTPVVFHTIQAVIELKDHTVDKNPLSGGVVQFGIGGWPVIGTTNSSGMVTRELFSGTYKFRMTYNYTTQEISQNISTPVIFQTALVDLHFSGTIQHQVGGWPTYTGPLEMLPVAHTFGFSGPGHARELLTFTPTAGTVFEKTILYTTVKASDGSGVSDVPAKWWNYGGSTSDAGVTNSNGHLLIPVDGAPTNTNVQVTYNGAPSQLKFQNPQTNSFYDFQLVKVTVELRDNYGNLIDASPDVTYHYYGVTPDATFGTMSGGSVSLDLLPASNTYFFTIADYNGGHQTISQHIAGTTTVVFQTGLVKDDGYGVTNYHQYGQSSHPFTNFLELLPGNYFFSNGTTTVNAQVYAGQILSIASDGSVS